MTECNMGMNVCKELWQSSPDICQCEVIAKARVESVDRAIIHLVLHGFHPDRPEWGQRFREAILR